MRLADEPNRSETAMRNRKRLLLVAAFVGLPAIFLFWRYYWLRWSADKLILSKETTYITTPLDEAGYPDYYAALNERLSPGVTPENNAAVLLLQAFGPAILPDYVDADEYCGLLGIKPLPRNRRYFEEWVEYAKRLPPEELPNLRPEEDRAPEDRPWLIEVEVSERPWRREEFPHVAAWLDLQQEHLDVVVAASKLPKYYAPMVRDGDSPLLIHDFGAMLDAPRTAISELAKRVFFRIGEREFDKAWEDLIAIHQLGRLFAQGPMILDAQIGMGMEATAFQGEAALLGTAQFEAEKWANLRIQFDAQPALSSYAEKLDLGRRFVHLDAICAAARYGVPQVDELFYGPPENRQAPSPFDGASLGVDWNVVLRKANEWMDRYVAAARIANPLDQSAALTALDWEAQTIGNSVSERRPVLSSLLSQRAASEHMADIFVGIFYSSLTSSELIEERNRAYRPLVRIGLALAHFHAENRSYPTKLSQLVPKYCKSIPQDPFAERPFRYRKTGDGYRLYSVGWNRRDDGGKGFNNEDESDDLLIEVPLKAKPKPTAANSGDQPDTASGNSKE
jgi:hypothetical protein